MPSSLILIDKTIHLNGAAHHLQVSSPAGMGGGSFNVLLDNYFLGKFVKYNIGWTDVMNEPCKLPTEYRKAILDKILGWEAEQL